MTQEVIDAFHNVLFDQRFELCETNEVKEGYKTIPLKDHHYYLRAKDGVSYKTISEFKHLLEFLLVNYEQVLKDNKTKIHPCKDGHQNQRPSKHS